MIGDKLYFSAPLREKLRQNYQCELIAPLKKGYRHAFQDRRKLRRMKRRWKIERSNSWLKQFKRLATRYERKLENFTALLVVACIHLYLNAF